MKLTLNTPIVDIKTVDKIGIIKSEHNVLKETYGIWYNEYLTTGQVHKKKIHTISGKDNIELLFAELEVIMLDGKGYEDANEELLYSKIADGTLTA